MSLLMPDLGLLFWMLIAFGIVFFILTKYGFPAITKSVEQRREFIDNSLKGAAVAEKKLSELQQESELIIAQANKEQGRLLREADQEREKIIAQAKDEAVVKAKQEIEFAREQIAREKEEALMSVRREVASLSCDIAEKVLREQLADKDKQLSLIDKMLDEIAEVQRVTN